MAERLVLCGPEAEKPHRVRAGVKPLKLRIGHGPQDVHIRFQDITTKMVADLSPLATDLLEIASYIYAADQATTRGGAVELEYGEKWRRSFRFRIPVRQPRIWKRPEVTAALTTLLSFLSDDDQYEFTFTKHPTPPPIDEYLALAPSEDPTGIEEVMLFSGGLDSFGGAVQETLLGQRHVALVSHASTSKVGAPQRTLVKQLRRRLPVGCPAPFHIPVTVNKGKPLGRDFTQRTRSFLFGSIASIVAAMFGLNRIRFYENGIISMNLPVSAQALGGRCSRTTHPRVLNDMGALLSLVFERPFSIQNPFLWHTKTDVLRNLKAAGCSDLCAASISCGHTWDRTIAHTHCGACSQCVDRRLVVAAAELDPRDDPVESYACDVLQSGLERHSTISLVERYVAAARSIRELDGVASFVQRYGEVARLLRHLEGTATEAARRVYELHRRHADQVHGALERLVSDNAGRIAAMQFKPTSLLGIVVGHQTSKQDHCRATPPSVSPASNDVPPKPAFFVDEDGLSVWWHGEPQFYGNTIDFRLLVYLNSHRTRFKSRETLLDEVWGAKRTGNVVNKTISVLRRRLQNQGVNAVRIESSGDKYALFVDC